jgi:predicted amidohydrolase YtcJ
MALDAHQRAQGVIPVPSPNWFYYDATFVDNNLAYLGSQRAEHMMPMKSLIDSGAVAAIGTDFPACGDYPTMNPLDEIKTGSLEAGKSADLIVLDTDLFKMPQDEINRSRVLITILEGRVAFGKFNESETLSLDADEFEELLTAYDVLFKDVAREDIDQASRLISELDGSDGVYQNHAARIK